jgi:hypothetical protein
MIIELTPLERACVEAVASVHWPAIQLDKLRVTSREDTGVGCYVNLVDGHHQSLPDGVFESGGRIVEMEGLAFGLDFALCVSGGQLHHLELVSPGPGGWDGIERPWKVV